MKEKISSLYSLNDKEAYKVLLLLESINNKSNKLYDYFDELLKMLDGDRTYVRIRGFRLICGLARWDREGKIDKNINKILSVLDDEIGISIRQYLQALLLLLTYKVELGNIVKSKLNNLELSKYKDSLRPLIQKNINKILEYL